ncbi:hypothetical protein EDC04DRAFT_2603046 [Pisolithus marmoratus]|nr:hypothetical protein EDC04DRAFT_2603046 [Pisolithus marmoratus]
MWAADMRKLEAMMKEIPDESAGEDAEHEWVEHFYEVLVTRDDRNILRNYASLPLTSAQASQTMTRTKTAISEAFKQLTEIQAQFPQHASKGKGKEVLPARTSQEEQEGVWHLKRQAGRAAEGERVKPKPVSPDAEAGKELSAPIGSASTPVKVMCSIVEMAVKVMGSDQEPCGLCMTLGIMCM